MRIYLLALQCIGCITVCLLIILFIGVLLDGRVRAWQQKLQQKNAEPVKLEISGGFDAFGRVKSPEDFQDGYPDERPYSFYQEKEGKEVDE